MVTGVANSEAIADGLLDLPGNLLNLLRSCFPAGTLVATPSGLFPIESINVGQAVWAYDLVRSEWVARLVLQKFVTDHDGTSAVITVADEAIEATFLHPLWVVHGKELASRPIREHLPRCLKGPRRPAAGLTRATSGWAMNCCCGTGEFSRCRRFGISPIATRCIISMSMTCSAMQWDGTGHLYTTQMARP